MIGDDKEGIEASSEKASMKKTWALRSKGSVPEIDWVLPPERAKAKGTKKATFALDEETPDIGPQTSSTTKDQISRVQMEVADQKAPTMIDKLLLLAEVLSK